MDTFVKQPVEVLDYDIDATDWLSDGDFIATAVSTVPTGITVNSTSVVEAGTKVKLWIAGGTSGTSYKIEVLITTDDGRVKQHEIKVKVKDF